MYGGGHDTNDNPYNIVYYFLHVICTKNVNRLFFLRNKILNQTISHF